MELRNWVSQLTVRSHMTFKSINLIDVRRRFHLFAGLTLGSLSLHGFASAQSNDEPIDFNHVSVVCPFKGEIGYEPERLKCGMISVPENRDDPNSRIIRLTYAQIIASARNQDEDEAKDDAEPLVVREDPVIYLTGGPGAGIDYYVKRFLKHDLTKTRDLYILSQRGIGVSGELCPFYSKVSREHMTSVNLQESEAEQAARMQACFSAAKAQGVDLTAYNTYENARDVKSLREALGFEKWNVWGISYGSHLGQMLTQVDPEGIRSLILDAIVPNDLGDLMRIHRWVGRNHTLIFDECERQNASVCEGLEERFYRAYDALVDSPITVPAADKELFPSGTVTVPPLIVGFAPFSMQYEQDEHPAIPAVMQALSAYAESRDEDIFKALGAMADLGGSSQGMSDAIRCNDGYYAAQAEVAFEDLKEDFGFKQGVYTVEGAQMVADKCLESGLPLADRKHYQLVKSDIPTLVVNGDWDPITPPPLAERIAPGFTNGRLIIVPYAGHGPTRSMSECATQVMNDFYDDPSQDLTQLDASCLEEGVKPPEFLSYVNTDAVLRLAAMASDDKNKIFGPAAYVIFLVATVLIGFFAILAGYIVRKFSTDPNVGYGIGPKRPRLLTLSSALLSIAGLVLIGVGAKATFDISAISFAAGLAPPANVGLMALLLSSVMGVWAIYAVLQANKQSTLRRRTKIGLPMISLSTVLLFVYLAAWGIGPF